MGNQRRRLLLGLAAVWTALAVGCASGGRSREVTLPPQTLTDAPTSTAVEEQALVSPRRENRAPAPEVSGVGEGRGAAAPADEAPGRRQTIVIQAGTVDEVTPQTLYEASATERQRRAGAEAPVAVITNRNLAEQAQGGQLTIVGPPADAVSEGDGGAADQGAAADAAGASAAASTLNEEYWRGQALKIRLDWKAAIETVDELEREVEELRRRFYEEDDPFYRDNQIKPAWDRALDTLAATRTAAEEHERKLARFLEEGRRSGALPGWLREGVEFEPPATPDRTPAERRRSEDPWEPRVLHEDPRDP